MGVQSIQLPNNQFEGQAAVGSFQTAGTLVTVPSLTAKPWAKFVCRHTGLIAGKWYGSYGGNIPTPTTHDFVLAPGEPEQRDCPPKGNITVLATADADGPLDWSLSYRT